MVLVLTQRNRFAHALQDLLVSLIVVIVLAAPRHGVDASFAPCNPVRCGVWENGTQSAGECIHTISGLCLPFEMCDGFDVVECTAKPTNAPITPPAVTPTSLPSFNPTQYPISEPTQLPLKSLPPTVSPTQTRPPSSSAPTTSRTPTISPTSASPTAAPTTAPVDALASVVSCDLLGNVVDCRNRGMTGVPRDIPSSTIILKLQGNDITVLRAGDFDNLPNLQSIQLQNNEIRHIEESVWSFHLTTGSLNELLMTGNPSSCEIVVDVPRIQCICAADFDLAALIGVNTRLFCEEQPTTATTTTTFTSSTTWTTRTLLKTTTTVDPAITTTRTITTTTPTTTAVDTWQTIPGRGCCADGNGDLYSWYLKPKTSFIQCQALCETEIFCRGVEYPWITLSAYTGKCTLLFDRDVVPNSLIIRALTNGTSEVALFAKGPVAAVYKGAACSRSDSDLCHRWCPKTSDARCAALATPFTPTYTNMSVKSSDLVTVKFQGQLPTDFAVADLTVESKSMFQTGMTKIVCSAKAAIVGIVGTVLECEQVTKIFINDVRFTDLSSDTEIVFHVQYNNTVLNGNAVVAGVLKFKPQDFLTYDIFKNVTMLSVTSPSASPTASPTSSLSQSSTSDNDDDVTLIWVSLGVAVVLLILILVAVYGCTRMRSLQHSLELLDKDTVPLMATDKRTQVMNPLAQFYGQQQSHQSQQQQQQQQQQIEPKPPHVMIASPKSGVFYTQRSVTEPSVLSPAPTDSQPVPHVTLRTPQPLRSPTHIHPLAQIHTSPPTHTSAKVQTPTPPPWAHESEQIHTSSSTQPKPETQPQHQTPSQQHLSAHDFSPPSPTPTQSTQATTVYMPPLMDHNEYDLTLQHGATETRW